MNQNNMRINSLLLALVLLFLLASCSKPLMQVINVNDTKDYKVKDYQQPIMLYALPQTVLHIKIDVQRTVVKHGPFAEFAKKYMSIETATTTDSEKWSLSNVSVSSVAEVDSNQFYIVKSSDSHFANLLSLTPKGLIAGVNLAYYEYFENIDPFWFDNETEYDTTQFTDLSVQRNFDKPENRPMYNRVKKDSTFVRVPLQEKQIVQKDLEKKAEEAANFIYKIRKRRAKLVDGEYEKFYENQALKTALDEIARLEEEYLSLFIGKTYTENYSYLIEFTPNDVNKKIANVLCRFSTEYGILESENVNGIPILLSISQSRTTSNANKFIDKHKQALAMQKKSKRNSGFYYRIPDEANITLSYNKKILTNSKLPIAQYGTIALLPAEVSNGNYRIEFYPELGAIKRIEKLEIDDRKKQR